MPHCDPSVLSLVALGEEPSLDDGAHLAGCSQCRSDVADLASVVSAVRVDVPSGSPVEPPARVWRAIADQTGVTVTPRGLPGGAGAADAGGAAAAPVRPASPAPEPSPVQSLPLRRRATVRRRTVLAVAAGALLVGGLAGSGITQLLTRDDQPRQPVVAQVGLKGLALAPEAGGKAFVVRTAEGPKLDVDVSALGPLQGQYYEVWLIDPSVKKMVAVGVLLGSSGQFAIPAGLKLADYPVVDISIQEPGNPAHSGKSVLRGTLPA